MNHKAQTDPQPPPSPLGDDGRTSTEAGRRGTGWWESAVPPGAPVWTPEHGDFA